MRKHWRECKNLPKVSEKADNTKLVRLAKSHLICQTVATCPAIIDTASKTMFGADYRFKKMSYSIVGVDKDLSPIYASASPSAASRPRPMATS